MVASNFRMRLINGASLVADRTPIAEGLGRGFQSLAQTYIKNQMRDQDKEYERGLIADERAYQQQLAQDEMMQIQQAARQKAEMEAQNKREANLYARYILAPDVETRISLIEEEFPNYDMETQEELFSLSGMDYETGTRLAEATLSIRFPVIKPAELDNLITSVARAGSISIFFTIRSIEESGGVQWHSSSQ